MRERIAIGCPSGYWGDAPGATAQLLAVPGIDYLVFDYLAEITMSILARARAKDPAQGYATDFVTAAVGPNLDAIARSGVKLIANAGGLNPRGCAEELRRRIAEAGLPLKVAAIVGDDIADRSDDLAAAGITDMFSGASFPPPRRVTSINAYLGASPIARALAAGADIVVTGRCVDSALALGACIDAFGWSADDWDRLAGGSLAGHILECGPQATGGNYTDWDSVPALEAIGYPIAEVSRDGSFTVTKPSGTGGMVDTGTIAEQMLYEIGDPQSYLLPDVACDFSEVRLTALGADRVAVSGARGRPPSSHYKVCATYHDGYRGGTIVGFYGVRAEAAATAWARSTIARSQAVLAAQNQPPLSATSVELLGAESHYGAHRTSPPAREMAVKIAVKHPSQAGVATFLREMSGFGLATPPGLTGFAATRPKPSPVVRLFSFLVDKGEIEVVVELEGSEIERYRARAALPADAPARPPDPTSKPIEDPVHVALHRLAWGRSGDKGDSVNIGIVARDPGHLPWIWAALTPNAVRERFAHFVKGQVERYLLPGPAAINFVLDEALDGGGTASLRMDPQGKGFAQLLLEAEIPVPRQVAEALA